MSRVLPLRPLLNLFPGHSQAEISTKTGIDHAQLIRLLRNGAIGHATADRAAANLGLHPVNIWGDQWLDMSAYRQGRIDDAFNRLRQEMAS